MNTTYNYLSRLLVCCLLSLTTHLSSAQSIDLSLGNQLDCSTNTFCVVIELHSLSGSLEIGTSSIFLDYNENALAFSSYESSNFDGSDLCIVGAANAWDEHAFDGVSVAGNFNLTMTLTNSNFSCPSVANNGVEVGVICFDIKDSSLDPDIRVNTDNTQFNSAATNDGSNLISVGTTSNLVGASIVDCSNPCISNGGDSDNDGVCDPDDQCPNFDDGLLGTACDDGDPCTTGEMYTNCGCTGGTLLDLDNDGVCDTRDQKISMSSDLDCAAKTLCVSIELQAISGLYEIGTSSIFLEYNEAALAYKSYTSSAFDGSDNCIANIATAWDAHSFDGISVPGDFNLTMTLLNSANSCPSISSTPTEVGIVCFDIINENVDPNIIVNTTNTNFNSAATNDGSDPIPLSSAGSLVGTNILDCSNPCINNGGDSDNDGVCDPNDQCPNFDDRLLGTACEDGDPCTTGETYTNCGCTGGIRQDSDNDGVCDGLDFCPTLDDALIGTVCDDNNDCTVGDTYGADCICKGITRQDSDNDGICDAEDQCPTLDNALMGTACDDNNDCTIGDIYGADCACKGTLQDSDNDGICDALDQCSTLNDNLLGTACDDGNPNTSNDIYNPATCTCAGIGGGSSVVTTAECSTPSLNILNNSLNGLNGFNAANIQVGAAIITATKLFTGSATADEDAINNSQTNGIVGIRQGVASSLGAANAMINTYEFSEEVCNLTMTVWDIDRTDQIEVKAYRNGVLVPYTISNLGSCVSQAGNSFISTCDVQVNGDINHKFDVHFGQCVDKVVYKFHNNTTSNNTGGSYTITWGEGCKKQTDCLPGAPCDDGNVVTECFTPSLFTLNNSLNGLNGFNAANIQVGSAIITASKLFTGSATADEDGINNSQTNGIVGIRQGVASSLGAANAMINTYEFSEEVCNLTMTVWDIDRTDQIEVKAYRNGVSVPYTISNLGGCVSQSGNSFISTCDVQVNGDINHKFDVHFGQCVDKVVYKFYNNTTSNNTGGSYTITWGEGCKKQPACVIGAACNDGDVCTVGEVYDADCNCSGGVIIDSDVDGVCNAEDQCPGMDDGLMGTACDDGNPCTTGETYINCACSGGTLQDMDGDGICDTEDQCPNLDDNLLGTACDDGNPCTIGETYTNCGCTGGTLNDQDNDGVCDIETQNIRLNSTLDCEAKTLCVSIALQSDNGAFEIGTSSIFLEYNNQVLAFASYTSSSFDGSDNCIANIASAWGEHSYDAISVPGDFNVTMTLLNNQNSCPTISSTPIEVGIVCFNILDKNGDPAISVNTENTNFNSAITNNGSNPILLGTTDVLDGPSVLDCSDPCISNGGDSDNDGVCDTEDQCPNLNDNLLGTACNDGDPCTTGEIYTDCGCSGGTIPDSDNDGVCDSEDQCPNLNDNLLGTACDDGDPCTTGETYTDCGCSGGTLQDSNNNGVCDLEEPCSFANGTLCDDNDDCTFGDMYNDCVCKGIVIPDFLFGVACNDGDPCTTGETYTDCGCEGGTLQDNNNNGVCDLDEQCSFANGTPCDDNDDCTFGDMYNDCVCKGILIPEFLVGVACNDGDPCTTGETYTDCGCSGGTLQDSNNNGVCDLDEQCSFVNGTPCNDGNPCTTGETYTDCGCSGGTLPDSDNDGVCDAEDQCPGFDDGLLGTTCEDGDPCTTGETYTDCGCSGGTLPDNDNDGVCDAEDQCPDLDDGLLGTACDDGNPLTINDEYSAINCKCEGVVDTEESDCNVAYTIQGNTINITGLDEPITNVRLLDQSWNEVRGCSPWSTGCFTNEIYSNLPDGVYYLHIGTFDDSWTRVCDIFETITLPAEEEENDMDGDGTIDEEDCQPTDPAYPTTPGTACDDGNTNTSNDVIQSDGCTCAGRITSTMCTADYTLDGNTVLVSGLNNPITSLKILDQNWNTVFECDPWSTACNSTEIISSLPDGKYFISISSFNNSWRRICNIFDEFTLPENTIQPNVTDTDGDGTPDDTDCQPTDPAYPATPGTACDDGTASTSNDVIQSDGCTCMGTTNNTPDCQNINITELEEGIQISGLGMAPISTIHVYTEDWDLVYTCVGSCNDVEDIDLLPGTYRVYARYYTPSWRNICDVTQIITIEGNAIAMPSSSRSNPVFTQQDIAQTLAAEMEIYPNPASKNVFVNLQSFAGQAGTLQVLNSVGQLINKIDLEEISTEPIYLNIAHALSGVHVIRLQLENGTHISRLLVVQE